MSGPKFLMAVWCRLALVINSLLWKRSMMCPLRGTQRGKGEGIVVALNYMVRLRVSFKHLYLFHMAKV